MAMKYNLDGSIMRDVGLISHNDPNLPMGGYQPLQYTSPKEEHLAARTSAWLGTSLTNMGAFDIVGPDAVRMLNDQCVNRDFAAMKIGGSRHAVMVDENGWLNSSSVLIRTGEESFRTYCLYGIIPAMMSGQYDVQFIPRDIFIYQVDGPKSLQIVEKAFQTDFHDLKFAQNKYAEVKGYKLLVHRLGMTGALAYEIQGEPEAADVIYDLLIEAGEEFGMKRLGIRQYMGGGVHTPGGYPNQIIHNGAPGWFEPPAPGQMGGYTMAGSSKGDVADYYLDLFDQKWDYLIDWDHDFVGKAALERQAAGPHRTAVTLIWDREDVGRVFAAGIYDPDLLGEGIDDYNDLDPWMRRIHSDKVFVDDDQVGVSQGRCVDYYTNQFVSLGFIDQNAAEEDTQVEVLWGEPGGSQYRVKAIVKPMPLFDGEWRNETCDVMKMVPERPYFAG